MKKGDILFGSNREQMFIYVEGISGFSLVNFNGRWEHDTFSNWIVENYRLANEQEVKLFYQELVKSKKYYNKETKCFELLSKEYCPTFKCNSKSELDIIEYYLKKWGYNVKFNDFEEGDFIVINYARNFGMARSLFDINSTTQYVVDSLNEFLDKVALLNGFYYTKNMVFNGIEIKPGMVITTSNGINYIAFPTAKGIAFTNNGLGGWTSSFPEDIIRIHDLAVGEFIDSGKILWEKPKKVVLTKQQIAEKFGINVEQLVIEN